MVTTGGVTTRPADAPLDDSNLGLAMLKGMGWTEGRGLGAGGCVYICVCDTGRRFFHPDRVTLFHFFITYNSTGIAEPIAGGGAAGKDKSGIGLGGGGDDGEYVRPKSRTIGGEEVEDLFEFWRCVFFWEGIGRLCAWAVGRRAKTKQSRRSTTPTPVPSIHLPKHPHNRRQKSSAYHAKIDEEKFHGPSRR